MLIKEESEMATSTFEREIKITNTTDLKKLVNIINSDPPSSSLSVKPYTENERKRSEMLLAKCLSRSRR